MPFRDMWKRFVRTEWFRLAYLVLLGALTSLLLLLSLGAAACLALIVIPLTVFVVPYWFGERKLSRFLVNGLVVFLIAAPLISIIQTQTVLGFEDVVIESLPATGQDETMLLRNGTVIPYPALGPASYLFRVQLLTTDNATPGAFEVWVNLTTVNGLSFSFDNFPMVPEGGAQNGTQNGTWFTTTRQLGDEVYGTGFSVRRNSTDTWTATPVLLAPIAASPTTFFGYFLLRSVFLVVFALGFYLFILFMWWWSARMKRRRFAPREEVEPTGDAEERPAAGGKAAKAAAFTCTNCGADVSADATACPKCGAVFED